MKTNIYYCFFFNFVHTPECKNNLKFDISSALSFTPSVCAIRQFAFWVSWSPHSSGGVMNPGKHLPLRVFQSPENNTTTLLLTITIMLNHLFMCGREELDTFEDQTNNGSNQIYSSGFKIIFD